jgi:hypothetical protein
MEVQRQLFHLNVLRYGLDLGGAGNYFRYDYCCILTLDLDLIMLDFLKNFLPWNFDCFKVHGYCFGIAVAGSRARRARRRFGLRSPERAAPAFKFCPRREEPSLPPASHLLCRQRRTLGAEA